MLSMSGCLSFYHLLYGFDLEIKLCRFNYSQNNKACSIFPLSPTNLTSINECCTGKFIQIWDFFKLQSASIVYFSACHQTSKLIPQDLNIIFILSKEGINQLVSGIILTFY